MDKHEWEENIKRIDSELIPLLREDIDPDAIKQKARIEFSTMTLSDLKVVYTELLTYAKELNPEPIDNNYINFSSVNINALIQSIEMNLSLSLAIRYPQDKPMITLLLKELKYRKEGIFRMEPDQIKAMVFITIRLSIAKYILQNRVTFGEGFNLDETKGVRALKLETRINAIKTIIESLGENTEDVSLNKIYSTVEAQLGLGSGDGRSLSEYIRRNVVTKNSTYPKSINDWKKYLNIS